MEKTNKPIPWFSGGLATLVALLIIAIALPNTNRVVVDQTVSPPRTYIQPQPWAVCSILAIAFVPVLCIFILGRRWKLFEYISWILLAALFTGTLMK